MTQQHSVLVADDSAFMRKLIRDMIQTDERFSHVYTARNGLDAVEKTFRYKPSVISMDIEMPVMNGIAAIEKIMKNEPTPIIMLSSYTERGAAETILGLEKGAVDFVQKPSGTISLDLEKVKQELLMKLALAANADLSRGRPQLQQAMLAARTPAVQNQTFSHLAAIGTSTGGPKALQHVLSQIPADYPAPILIVQHMPPPFTRSLAQRLDELCPIKVVEAEDRMPIRSGTAYIAPGDWHMTAVLDQGEYKIKLHDGPHQCGHRPSVDVLFRSLLALKDLQRSAVLMTGMGRDGAEALKALREDGAVTLAEARETCIVYGMPKAAVEIGAADRVVPLGEIAAALIAFAGNN